MGRRRRRTPESEALFAAEILEPYLDRFRESPLGSLMTRADRSLFRACRRRGFIIWKDGRWVATTDPDRA